MITMALDGESTGVDHFHGTEPFYFTTAFENGQQQNFEWKVDPLTREVLVEPDDVEALRKLIDRADRIIGQNLKFDAHLLSTIGIELPFSKIEDTLIASHVLASGMLHDLMNLVRQYLPPKYDIERFEKELDEAAKSARRYARSHLKDWKIAHEGLDGMPSMKGTPHKYDLWLPKAVAEHEGFDKDHEHYNWHTVLEVYASHDSAAVMMLWPVMERELKKQGLWKIYRCRMELPYIAKKMEHYGVTANVTEINRLEREYTQEAEYLEKVCVNIADGYNYELDLPKGPRNKNLETFLFDVMKIPVLEYTESDKPSLNAEVKERYEQTLPRNTKPQLFMKSYNRKTELEKAVGTLKSYKKFGVCTDNPDYVRIHSNLNPTGTNTLQWSSSNPNSQNVGEQSTANLRRVFGPMPGREWYSMDGKNLQLRIPAFEADEKDLIEVFNNPDQGPYFGSYHMVIFDIVHPEKFQEYGVKVKDSDNPYYQWYKRVKNGNFCVPMTTTALTSEGWKSYDEVQIGDKVLGYDGGKLKWNKVIRKFKFNDAPLIKIRNHHFEAVTTSEHRWIGTKRKIVNGVRGYYPEFFTTKDITAEHTITLSAEVCDNSRNGLTKWEAAVLALVYTDGHIEQGKFVDSPSQAGGRKVRFDASIHQSKPAGIEYIQKVLDAWGGGYKTSFRPKTGIVEWRLDPESARGLWRKSQLRFGVGKFDQDFEELVLKLGTEARKEFLNAVHVAEGHRDRRGEKIYSQNEGKFADAIRLAIFMCGNYVTQGVATKNGLSDKNCLRLRACKPFVNGTRIVKGDAGRGDVWCIETELGTWVMRQGDRISLTGNCRQFGGQREKVDATFGVTGAFDKIAFRFPKIDALSRKYVALANRQGYVETIPDISQDPTRGYPLMTERNEWQTVSPTIPFCYHIAGTAQQWMYRGMTRCEEQLVEWRKQGSDIWMIIQVHDELVFDAAIHPDNRNKMLRLKGLLEIGGQHIGVPTPVSCEHHPESWAVGVAI